MPKSTKRFEKSAPIIPRLSPVLSAIFKLIPICCINIFEKSSQAFPSASKINHNLFSFRNTFKSSNVFAKYSPKLSFLSNRSFCRFSKFIVLSFFYFNFFKSIYSTLKYTRFSAIIVYKTEKVLTIPPVTDVTIPNICKFCNFPIVIPVK